MTPLPALLTRATTAVVAWRLDAARHVATWDSGVGAELVGGRWNPKGVKTVYCSLDPATTILESAVHRGFMVLDTQPFFLTAMELVDVANVHIVDPSEVEAINPAWLHGGVPSAGQQAWGAALAAAHDFVVLPSVVSKSSWNLIFRPDRAAGKYARLDAERLVLDTRLNPPAP